MREHRASRRGTAVTNRRHQPPSPSLARCLQPAMASLLLARAASLPPICKRTHALSYRPLHPRVYPFLRYLWLRARLDSPICRLVRARACGFVFPLFHHQFLSQSRPMASACARFVFSSASICPGFLAAAESLPGFVEPGPIAGAIFQLSFRSRPPLIARAERETLCVSSLDDASCAAR